MCKVKEVPKEILSLVIGRMDLEEKVELLYLGGSPTDPGMPVTHEDILNGVKQPGGTFPPATQIQ